MPIERFGPLGEEADRVAIRSSPSPLGQHLLARPRRTGAAGTGRQIRFPSYTRVYPLVVARGSGAVIEDVDGNRFLDMTAGIAVTATGHCHPEVVAAIKDQADKLLHMSGTDFYYEPQIDLAQRLGEAAPGPSAKRVFFTNSGAEALEAGLKLARYHTGRTRVIAFLGAFHGRTYGAMSLSGSKLVHRRGFSPLVPDIHHVPFPRSCDSDKTGGVCQVIRDIETLMQRVAPPDEVAAIFMEPIQGESGYHVRRRLPAGNPPIVRQAQHSAGPRRGPVWHGPDRKDVCLRALGHRAGHRLPGQGHRQRYAARGDYCP